MSSDIPFAVVYLSKPSRNPGNINKCHKYSLKYKIQFHTNITLTVCHVGFLRYPYTDKTHDDLENFDEKVSHMIFYDCFTSNRLFTVKIIIYFAFQFHSGLFFQDIHKFILSQNKLK